VVVLVWWCRCGAADMTLTQLETAFLHTHHLITQRATRPTPDGLPIHSIYYSLITHPILLTPNPSRHASPPHPCTAGNCDIKNLTRGCKVFLPVFVEGANLSMGDMHFSQGDGEVSFCGERPGSCPTVGFSNRLVTACAARGCIHGPCVRASSKRAQQAHACLALSAVCHKGSLSCTILPCMLPCPAYRPTLQAPLR